MTAAPASRERPILFSGEMVRAILAGRKTMTRRIIKPQPQWVYADSVPVKTDDADPDGAIHCPYGKPGDLLWVRETWSYYGGFSVSYKADGFGLPAGDERWRPSIHMPRRYSRITLRVTAVRVERLGMITEEDAKAEGCDSVADFLRVWDRLHGGHDPAPWVWVVSFERVRS